jgi:hypothetical protein
MDMSYPFLLAYSVYVQSCHLNLSVGVYFNSEVIYGFVTKKQCFQVLLNDRDFLFVAYVTAPIFCHISPLFPQSTGKNSQLNVTK